MAHKISLIHERGYVAFDGVTARARCIHDFGDRDTPVVATEFENLNR